MEEERNILQSGMTFLELIIAIFILIVGIAGSFGLTQKAISSSRIAMNQITANYLAQEGLEVVRNIRDNNLAQKDDWSNRIIIGCPCCMVSYNSFQMTECTISTVLKKDGNGFYSHNGSIETDPSFSRKIETSVIDDCILVKSIVSWDEDKYSVTMVEKLCSWNTTEYE